MEPNSSVRASETKPEFETISTALEMELSDREKEEKERRENRMREIKKLAAIDGDLRSLAAEFGVLLVSYGCCRGVEDVGEVLAGTS